MPQEYEHVEFKFSKSTGIRDGSSFQVTAYLLVPAAVMPELTQWLNAEEQGLRDGRLSGKDMFDALKTKGALLHREDGPAYTEALKKPFERNHPDIPNITVQQYWEKGVEKTKRTNTSSVKPLGKITL